MSRINTNVQSLIATRVLGKNQDDLNRSLTRLSTGLRINTGKDDPAGLIASETLRAAKVSITAAIDNANRADSIVSVAEGGLQEINALLLEIESLVDRSANSAGLSDEEVKANQLQLDSILQSINRIADATAFGDKKLLNGNFEFTASGVNILEPTGTVRNDIANLRINAAKVPEGSYRNVVIERVASSTVALVSATGNGIAGGNGLGSISDDITIEVTGVHGSELFSFASGTAASEIRDSINSSTQLTGVSAFTSGQSVIFSSTGYGDSAFVSVSRVDSNAQGNFDIDGSTESRQTGADGTILVNGTAANVDGLDITVRSGSLALDATLYASFAGGGIQATQTSFEITGGGAVFSIGPKVGLASQEAIGVTSVTAASLGSAASDVGFLSSLGSGESNNLSSGNFAQAQRVVRSAIDQISSLRGRLGAFQRNTLATTINSLGVAFENISAAESAIRDADFAVETSALTRSQILVNASTATLQLANAAPQNVLALLG